MKIPDNLDNVISEEHLKMRVQQIISLPKESKFEKITKNPLFTLFIGFLLTSILGSLFAYYISANEKKNDYTKLKRTEELLSVNRISELMYNRYAISTLLASSLDREAPISELKERKKIYDGAYIEWIKKIQSTQLEIRNLNSETNYSSFDQLVDSLTHCFTRIDSCLTTGYDARVGDEDNWKYNNCAHEDLRKAINLCYTITDTLFKKINIKYKPD